jgi:hypothetical protein
MLNDKDSYHNNRNDIYYDHDNSGMKNQMTVMMSCVSDDDHLLIIILKVLIIMIVMIVAIFETLQCSKQKHQ